jgi:hypothetical protein
MRTGLYVFQPTEVTVQPLDPEDRDLTITPYNPDLPESPAVGTLNLAAGVYLIVSRGELRVSGDHIRLETSGSDKDPWPELLSDVVARENGTTQASIKQFFQISKGIDL